MGLPLPASASVPIDSFNAVPSTAQAGAHPDFLVHFVLSTNHQTNPTPCACNDARVTDVHLPAGLIANPHATPQCTVAAFAADHCPVDSQVGVTVNRVGGNPNGGGFAFLAPIFNLVPPPEDPGLLGYKSALLDTPTFEVTGARTATDYGLDVDVTSIEHFSPLTEVDQVTWGVPAAPVHDYLRFGLGETSIGSAAPFGGAIHFYCNARGNPSTDDPTTVFQLCGKEELPAGPVGADVQAGGPGGPVASQSLAVPFLQNPTACGATSLLTSLDVLAYDGGETHADSTWPATTDCVLLSFNPSQSFEPTTTAADSSSGAEFRLTVPQFESPSVPSPSELRAATLTLPEGFSLSPNAANGKTTCSEAEALTGPYASTAEGHCPEDSKIGSIAVETPVLPGPLPGYVYLGEPRPGNRFRLFLLVDGFGVHVKLAGTITPNPQTGRVEISFQDLPQTPFAAFSVHVFGSERGPLDTPTQCGTYEVQGDFTPWDSALSSVTSRQFFEVSEGPGGSPCPNGPAPFGPPRPRPFHPGFQAASASNTAAAHTAFSLNLTRADGEQNLKSLMVTTPPGFAATLKGVSYCPDAAIAVAALQSHTGLAEQQSPSCPASSLVGELTAAAGPGTHPLYLPGKVYLAGPYQGAPLSLVLITPAVSGGYDLGNVVVREGLKVNPETAQVSTAGAPLPQIFQGIPLRLRSILVSLNRKNFALNPTNCNPLEVKAQVFGNEGTVSTSSELFLVGNCASLSFAPKLTTRFSGSTKRAGNPALKATVTYPQSGSYANIASTAVTLPPTEQIDNAHIQQPCTRVQFAANACPASSVIGTATAVTPLLEKPLEGPVYLMTGFGHKLPDLFVALKGQIDINLDGRVDTVHKAIRTTFATVPDAPVSKFTLSLDGGNKGLLQNDTNLCKFSLHASVKMDGQNGKRIEENPELQTSCGKKGKKHHKRARVSRATNANRGGGR